MVETIGESPTPRSYSGVINTLKKVVTPYTSWEDMGDGHEIGIDTFDGAIRPFLLPMDFTQNLGMGRLVRCRVIGSVEEGMGIALVIKSLNPFNRKVHGFYLQPTPSEDDGPALLNGHRGYEVWEGPAKWPSRRGLYWGSELLERDKIVPADSTTADTLISTIQKHADYKSRSFLAS